jgi:F0F1-type ATP synthase assembly protein I
MSLTDTPSLDDLNLAAPTESETPAEVSPESEEARINPFAALLGVIFRPRRTFAAMRDAKSGHWWLAALISLIAISLAFAVTGPRQMQMRMAQSAAEQQRDIEDGAPPPPDDQAAQQAQVLEGSLGVIMIAGFVFSLVGMFIGYLLHAALLYLLGLAMGGRATFKQVFRMGVWTLLPAAVRAGLSGIAALVTGGLPAAGLSAAMTGAEFLSAPVLGAFLGWFDFYRLWTLILVGVGAAATYKLNRGKSLILVLIYAVVSLIMTSALGAFALLGPAITGG